MNPDLSMGEDLLKKTRAGNMFTVFGQPDIEIRSVADGQVQAEIRGLDVYDPTTGEIRSQDVADIACWLIDTAYTARRSSSVTRTSRAPTIPTRGSRPRFAPRLMRLRGRP